MLSPKIPQKRVRKYLMLLTVANVRVYAKRLKGQCRLLSLPKPQSAGSCEYHRSECRFFRKTVSARTRIVKGVCDFSEFFIDGLRKVCYTGVGSDKISENDYFNRIKNVQQ
jgi:hypothetical protein